MDFVVTIDVDDLDEAVRFYQAAFGLKLGRRFGGSGVEMLGGPALAAGSRLEATISTAKWGKLALMADPFGHGFCFIEFLGRGYDEIAD